VTGSLLTSSGGDACDGRLARLGQQRSELAHCKDERIEPPTPERVAASGPSAGVSRDGRRFDLRSVAPTVARSLGPIPQPRVLSTFAPNGGQLLFAATNLRAVATNRLAESMRSALNRVDKQALLDRRDGIWIPRACGSASGSRPSPTSPSYSTPPRRSH
jgi:hypothetical protein